MQLQNDMRWFDRARDLDAVKRIWREVGWAEDRDDELAMEDFFSIGSTLTGVIDGEAECAVHTTPGLIRLDQTDLNLCAVTAVTTSRIGRKRRFAQRLTATQLACGAEAGAAVSALGMFEQGFYDRVGFGAGSYQNVITFDPATLTVDVPLGTPVRLDTDDWRDMHGAVCRRARVHGGVVLHPAEVMAFETMVTENGFGLGFRDDDDTLTHFMWCETKSPEFGPLRVTVIAYETPAQMMELLAMLRSLGDQIRSVEITEPAHIQLQDWLDKPFRSRGVSRNSVHAGSHRAPSWWQLRILDVPACVAALSAAREVPPFRLQLSDPASDVLAGAWPGVSGTYTVRLGEASEAKLEDQAKLPTVVASVNAFSGLVFGIAPASVLALADDFAAPEDLVAQLDRGICLPPARPALEF